MAAQGEEIEAYMAAGIITHAGLAFSRDGKDKSYIQHKMKQDKSNIYYSITRWDITPNPSLVS